MEQEFDLRAYLNIAKRRFVHFALPASVVLVAAVAVVMLLPKSYVSKATILVESQQIPSDLARSTVTSAAEERIALIRQRLIARKNLLQIVSDFNLYPEEQEKLSPTEIVAMMREATTIEQINIGNRQRRNARQQRQIIAFTVSFEYGNAQTAARVANQFVNLILEQNIKSRTSRASETHKFFEQQVSDLELKLAKQEAEIIRFKSENEAALPESLAYRRTLLTELQSRIPEIDQRVLTLEADRKLLISGQTPADETTTQDPTAVELANLKSQLRQLQSTYSDQHPSVVKAKKRLAALEKEIEAAKVEQVSVETDQAPGGADPDTPKLAPDAVAKVAAIDQQLSALKEQRTKEMEKIAVLEEMLRKTPQVEVALNALNRNYEALATQLSQAKVKMAEAATGEQLEEDRQAERFEVVEQATAPSKPSKPNRGKFFLAGLMASLAAGAGIAMMFEVLDQSMYTARDFQNRLKMRPLATIPVVRTKADLRARKRKIWFFLFAQGAVAAVAVLLIHTMYQPVDLLWLKFIQKVGL